MKPLFDLSFRKIQYYLMVVEEGSLTRAAKRLFISQPMLSKAVKELEQELAIQLFKREGKYLEVTFAGRYLYEQWYTLLDQMERVLAETRELANEKKHTIYAGCEHIMVLGANALWMDALEQFQLQHPDIHVDMSAFGLHEVKKRLLSRQLDFMICSSFDTEGLQEDYHCEKLGSLPVVIYGRAQHPVLRRTSPVTWKDLKNCSFYTISPLIASWPQELLFQYGQQHGFQPRIAGYTDTQLSQVMKIKTSDALMLSLRLDSLLQDEKLSAVTMKEETEIMLVWRKDCEAAVSAFAHTLLHQEQGAFTNSHEELYNR